MCCGRKRSALRGISVQGLGRATAQPAPSAAPDASGRPTGSRLSVTPSYGRTVTELRLVFPQYVVESSAIRVWGPVTGRQYTFSAAQPVVAADPRDAAMLSGTRFFRRV